MSDDYLWDKSGPPDPDVRHLEEVLGRLRHRPDGSPLAPPPPVPSRAAPSRPAQPRWRWWLATPLVAAAAVVAAIVLRHDEPPPTPVPVVDVAWQVTVLSGSPSIADAVLTSRDGVLRPGEWLETNTTAHAMVSIPSVGIVDIQPGTRMRLITARSGEHRVAVARGSIKATIFAPPRVFFVETPSAVAIDLGCSYTLAVDAFGVTLLRVLTGWVAFEFKNVETVVPAGASCTTRPGSGPGLPLFEDAAAEFRTATAKIEDGDADPALLGTLFTHARRRDGVTLWHLLPRRDESDRGRIFDHLASVVPPPAGVTRAGIVGLDPKMLARWSDGMKDAWSPWNQWRYPDDGK